MIKSILIFIFSAMTFISIADVAPVRFSANSKWIIVDKTNTKYNSLQVSIKDKAGITLVNERIKKTTKYNLKYVPDGSYTLLLEDEQRINTINIRVSGNQIVQEDSKIIFKPYFMESENFIDLNLMTQGRPVEITLRDNENKVYKSLAIRDEVSITRRFNVKELEKGRYFLDVRMDGKVFPYEFVR